jgi:protein-S-isoprenylcysteine O-methyltransferase Ste14
VIIVLILSRTPLFHGHPAAVHNPALQTIGVVLFVAGLGFAVWARVHLGANWGVPMSQRLEPDLVTSGPYRLVRNPIYTGVLAAFAGTALATTFYWLIALAVIGPYFAYSAIVEEHTMEEAFPGQYPAYRSRTKRFIPFVW